VFQGKIPHNRGYAKCLPSAAQALRIFNLLELFEIRNDLWLKKNIGITKTSTKIKKESDAFLFDLGLHELIKNTAIIL